MEAALTDKFTPVDSDDLKEIDGGVNWRSVGAGIAMIGSSVAGYGGRYVPHPVGKVASVAVGATLMAIGGGIVWIHSH